MSQPSVTAYFNTRKRPASDDIRNKSKVLLLEQEQSSAQACDISKGSTQNVTDQSDEMVSPKIILRDPTVTAKDSSRVKKVVRNIHFDSPKSNTEKTIKTPKARGMRSRRLFSDGHQVDIRESLQKMGTNDTESRKVHFEKKGSLSPKKPMTTTKSSFDDTSKHNMIKEEDEKEIIEEQSTHGLKTTMEKPATENLSLTDIKNRINKSSRLLELRASIARIKSYDQQLEKIEKQNDIIKPQIQKFEKIELEIPVR